MCKNKIEIKQDPYGNKKETGKGILEWHNVAESIVTVT
jgi:hypothetical protein